MLTVFPSGLDDDLDWCHIPGAWAALGPKVELDRSWAEGATEDVPALEPHLDVECLIPCGWDPKLQIQVGPPIAQARIPHYCLLLSSTGCFSMTWDVSGGYRGAGEKQWPGSSDIFHCNFQTRTLSKAPVAQWNRLGHDEVLLPCGHFL